MAQVYRFTDSNGEVRLMAEISPAPGGGPAAGTYVPVGRPSGVSVDTTTYTDPVSGGALTTLVFPNGADDAVFGVANAGDAHPRLVIGCDPTDFFLGVGDGTADPGNVTVSYAGAGGGFSFGGGVPTLFDDTVGAAAAIGAAQVPQLAQVSPKFTITSGALSTVQLVTATGAQILTTRDAETITPCTFNPGVATTATVTVALSPDNVTYSTLGVETEPVGTVFDGTIRLVKVRVPAGWYLKLTANAQAVLGLTTYY